MVVFENVRVVGKNVKVDAYINDEGPKQKLSIQKFSTSCCDYSEHMLVDRQLWYLMAAINKKMVKDGQTCTVLDNAPDMFDESFVKVA